MSESSPGARRAFVDESYRSQLDGGTYLFAAVTIRAADEDVVRRLLRGVLGSGRRRLHWRDDTDRDRTRALEAIATAPLDGVTIYRTRVVPARAERARQAGLWDLVADLADRGINDVVFEGRERRLDRRDAATLSSITRVWPHVRHVVARPLDEPLLWTADYLAGAVGVALGGDTRFRDVLPERLVRTVELMPLDGSGKAKGPGPDIPRGP